MLNVRKYTSIPRLVCCNSVSISKMLEREVVHKRRPRFKRQKMQYFRVSCEKDYKVHQFFPKRKCKRFTMSYIFFYKLIKPVFVIRRWKTAFLYAKKGWIWPSAYYWIRVVKLLQPNIPGSPPAARLPLIWMDRPSFFDRSFAFSVELITFALLKK